jgi:uncharacterized membrane protein YidH (DUF202 family)
MSPESQAKAGLSDLLAAEGTFLAWIRTGLALVGFGFVVALRAIFAADAIPPADAPQSRLTGSRCGSTPH